MQHMKGTFFIVIGPTGSGKSTLMKHVIAQYPELTLPYSYTTRARRPDAVENDHYRFVTKEEFEQMIREGVFLEWAQYGDNYYGTKRDEVVEALSEGKVLLKEMEAQGARQTKQIIPAEQLKAVYVYGGSWEELESRIRSRAPMTDEEVALRKEHYDDEAAFMDEADVVIQNLHGEGEGAKQAFSKLIEEALHAS